MKLLRTVLLALMVQDLAGVFVGMAFGGRQTAALFALAAIAAFATLAAAEWFVAQTDAYGRSHGLTTPKGQGDE